MLCVQFAHPIAGLTGSALSFLFPHLSRSVASRPAELGKTLMWAFGCNLLLVATGAGLLLLAGERLIRSWAGADVARSAAGLLPCVVAGSALMGLSVTATYALLAMGDFRLVALANMAMRVLMLVAILLAGIAPQGVGAGVDAAGLWGDVPDALRASVAEAAEAAPCARVCAWHRRGAL